MKKKIFIFFLFLVVICKADTIVFSGKPGERITENIEIIPNQIVSIFPQSLLDLELFQYNFSNQSSKVKLNISLVIPNKIASGNYNIGFLKILKKNGEIEKYNLSLRVEAYKNLSVECKEYDVNSGESGIAHIYLKNLGNTLISNISFVDEEPNSKIILEDLSNLSIARLIPYNFIFVPIPFHIDKSAIGVMERKIKINSNIGDSECIMKFNITDKSPPNIMVDADFDKQYGEKLDVCFTISDNNEIKYAKAIWENDTFELGSGKICKEFSTKHIGKRILRVTAEDKSGNKVDKNYTFKISKIPISKIASTIKIEQIKVGNEIKKKIFKLPNKENLKIRLNFTCENNKTDDCIRVSLSSDSGDVKLRNEKEVSYMLNGNVYIVIEALKKDKYFGKIYIDFPEYYDVGGYKDYIEFDGEIGEYSTCKKWQGKIWDFEVETTPHDTGIYDTSFCEVKIKEPIDIEIEKLRIPVTKSQEKDLEEKWLLKEKIKEQYIHELELWRIALFIFILILIFVLIFNKYKDRILIST